MKILHIDIETAPNVAYVWGLFKQNISINHLIESGYTMCWSAKWHDEKEIMFERVKYKKNGDIIQSSKKKMLKKVWKLLDEADAVVHYNGNSFDIPILNRDFLLCDLEPPAPYHQIDLLRVSRSRFRFISNKLDFISQELGFSGKQAHTGFRLWVDCMRGDNKAWKLMEKYNKQDVFLLEDVYLRYLPWIKDHPNHALYTDDTRPVCPNCGSNHVNKKGTETTKAMSYQRYRCQECHTNIRGKVAVLDKEKRKNILTQSKL